MKLPNNLLKNETTILAWLTLFTLIVLVVLSVMTSFRLLAIQNYLPEFAEHFEEHIDELQTIAQSAQAQPDPATITPVLSEIILDGEPILGNVESSEVLIVEFLDFECAYCAQASNVLQEILKQYPGQVTIIHKDYPLPFHTNALLAAQAANCAGDQGKYWEMHDLLFEDQQRLDLLSLKERAVTLSLDQELFNECLSTKKYEDEINQDFEYGKGLNVSGTPAFIVGRKYQVPDSESLLLAGYLVFQNDLLQKVEEMLASRTEE